jgi:hypothetical protein
MGIITLLLSGLTVVRESHGTSKMLALAFRGYALVIKAMHVLRDVVEAILNGEVSSLKPMHLGHWQIG